MQIIVMLYMSLSWSISEMQDMSLPSDAVRKLHFLNNQHSICQTCRGPQSNLFIAQRTCLTWHSNFCFFEFKFNLFCSRNPYLETQPPDLEQVSSISMQKLAWCSPNTFPPGSFQLMVANLISSSQFLLHCTCSYTSNPFLNSPSCCYW
jgi:hypothetical protein